MLNWTKKSNIEMTAMGERLNNMQFEILGSHGHFVLLTKIAPNTVHELMNEIGSFKTLERARMIAELIDEG